MDISSVMKKEVVSISEDETLDDAIELLAARRVGLLPVVDAEFHLVGILTLRSSNGCEIVSVRRFAVN